MHPLILIALAIIVFIFETIVTYRYVIFSIVLFILAAKYVPIIVRHISKKRYFASEEFLAGKKEIAAIVSEHNDVAEYVQSIRSNGSFDIGISSTGKHAHLASFENTSNHNYQRERNVTNFGSSNVHNCSLQIVRSASQNPIKYLMKYFNVKADEESLSNVEKLGESVSRLDHAIDNLKIRESSIAKTFAPPEFILEYFHDDFMQHVGVEISPVEVPYPVYSFEYVSAGGNSGQQTTIKLDTLTIDALIETMSEKIRFRKTAAGQRALMTAKFREFIKNRDNYRCKQCAIGIADEPHLLLEVDHIIPVSKGGLSIEKNLQTLCWRCNRTKSNKLVAA